MAKTGFAEKSYDALAGDRSHQTGYRAVTQGGERDEWAVVNDRGSIVFRGDARVAAMIAGRLTRPAR